MSNLIPEQRVDRNGHLVTRHVRTDSGAPSSLLSSLPVPALKPQQSSMTTDAEFDEVKQRNVEFRFRENVSDVTMTADDLRIWSRLIDTSNRQDEDGDTRVWSVGQIMKTGDTNAARFLVTVADTSACDIHLIVDTWEGCTASGVMESGKEYADSKEAVDRLEFIMDFYQKTEGFFNVLEGNQKEFRELARIYEAVPEVDVEEVAEFAMDRDEVSAEAYLEYSQNETVLREGTL